MKFYVGLDDLYYAFRFDRAFISVNRLWTRRSPFRVNNWILDSGAFSEISKHGEYVRTVREYAEEIERWRNNGNMECAVAQDWMCEPAILELTELTVADHQKLTIERYDALRGLTDAPLMPVLQGYKPSDYIRHLNAYGDRLQHGARVGVGSVCKRNGHPAVIEYILKVIKAARPDLLLHGFGLKLTSLHRPDIRKLLHSSDSMAWSLNARKNGRSAHDWTQADNYRERIENPPKLDFEWNS